MHHASTVTDNASNTTKSPITSQTRSHVPGGVVTLATNPSICLRIEWASHQRFYFYHSSPLRATGTRGERVRKSPCGQGVVGQILRIRYKAGVGFRPRYPLVADTTMSTLEGKDVTTM